MRSFVLLATSLAFLFAPAKLDAQDEDRQAIEAASLFRAAFAGENKPEQCFYDVEWGTAPVPMYMAQEVFGITVHAGLLADSSEVSLQNVLDQEKKFPEAFCSDKTWDDYRRKRLEDLKAGVSPSIVIRRRLISFPVFDASYKMAIVMYAEIEIDARRVNNPSGSRRIGDIAFDLPDGFTYADIYMRDQSGWRRIKREIIGQT